MNDLFTGAAAFNQPLANWNTTNVAGMNGIFYDAVKFNQNINNWNVHKVIVMSHFLEVQ